MTVYVNGTPHDLGKQRMVYYRDVLRLAGFKADRVISVTYNHALHPKYAGILMPGQRVRVSATKPYAVFEAADTSQA